MQFPIAMALLVASIPIILALCRVIGPGRATPFAILGAFLILTRYNPDEKVFGIFTIDKLTVAGLSLAIGLVLFDRKTLVTARFRWVDFPMLLYIASPLIGIMVGKSSDVRGSLDQSWMIFAQWGVPYLMGRLYFADPQGARRLAIAVTVAGLLYIPFCCYEMALGKDWFLRPLLFQIPTGGDYRLGGWRPLVMLTNGLELVSWMALSTVMATWLWACGERWKTKHLPVWLPPVALLLTTIACRGVYGYTILAIGLAAIGLLSLVRTRWVLAPLLLLPVAYIALRATGTWDGRELIRLAQITGDRAASSVALRISMENDFIRESIGHNMAFGLGGRFADSWADGWWLTLLRRGGLVALATHYSAFLLPAVLFLARKTARSPLATAQTGLALFIILHMIDSLHNTPLIAVTTLLGGSLAGSFLSEHGRVSNAQTSPRRASTSGPGHATYRLGELGPSAGEPAVEPVEVCFVLAIACLLYVPGHAEVDGQQVARFVGGLGSALLFAAAGAVVAGSRRRSMALAILFGLAFAGLGVTFNLAFHASSRPIGSADILQGLALSGIAVAGCRRVIGKNPWAFSGLAVLAASWWAIGSTWPSFPGSQYLYPTTGDPLSLFPALPWLSLAAWGAVLAQVSALRCVGLAIGLGVASAVGWDHVSPFGPPVKFPLNATYAMLGGSLAATTFAVAKLARSWKRIATLGTWLGRRWLVFFYVHLGIAEGLRRVGLTDPVACWAALGSLSIAATWMVSAIMDRLRSPFRHPATWAAMGLATVGVGLVPSLPALAVSLVAGSLGLFFAAHYDELAGLILGPALDENSSRSGSPSENLTTRYLVKVAFIVVALLAPELCRRLPVPIGVAPLESTESEPRPTPKTEGR